MWWDDKPIDFKGFRFNEPMSVDIRYHLVGYTIEVSRIILNEKADLIIQFYDEKCCLKISKVITLEGEEYTRWGNDDAYLYEYVFNNLDKILANSKLDL